MNNIMDTSFNRLIFFLQNYDDCLAGLSDFKKDLSDISVF